jgi:hypothetical protein
MNNRFLISTAWRNFTSDILNWFTRLLRTQYNVDSFPPQYYLFRWSELKSKMEETYASTFATKDIWRDLETLKSGSNLSEFHSRFLNLTKLVGETAHTATYCSQLYDVYTAKMSDLKCQIFSSLIVTGHQTGHMIDLHHPMNVVDELNLLQGGCGNTLGNSGACTAAMFVPGRMELGSISQSNACTRCGGRGHWSYFCATPMDWKEGDLIKKPDFDKAKRSGREKEKGETGHERCGQNNATEAEAATGEGAAEGGGENGGGGNVNFSQVGND